MAEIDSTQILNLDPTQDLFKRGFDNGILYTLYNFVNHELDSNPQNTYFISEISSDRTEIRLSSNFIDNARLEIVYKEFKERLDSTDYFDEFYIAFAGNNYNIGVNCFLDTSKEKYTLLVKLYDALPTQFKDKDEVYVVTKTAETKVYKVNQDPSSPSTDPINPGVLFEDGFELDNQSIIPNENINSTFTPDENNIELYIYDVNLGLLASDLGVLGPDGKWQGFSDYTITDPNGGDLEDESNLGEGVCSLGPEYTTQQACTEAGGTWTSTDGGTCSLGPEYTSQQACTEAGGIWTSNNESANGSCSLGPEFSTKEACLSAGGQWTPSNGSCSLGPQFTTQTACAAAGGIWSINKPGVCTLGPQYTTQYACIAAGGIWHNSEIYGDATFLRGPNTNLEIKDFVNNSTVYKTKDELLSSPSTSSRNNLDYYLNQRGVTITPDYSKFNEFVNFSSAKQRVQNFYHKVSQIQSYEDELSILNSITGNSSESISVTSSKASIEGNITNLIKNFDGYEYYLYYITGSSSYPKTGTKFPYELKDTGSIEVLNWLGSSNESSQYYGGTLLSASFYDEDNQNWLFYTVPDFIKENENNDNYLTFCNMVGQSFDEIWLYTKAVSQKTNTTNTLDEGVPLDLAQPTIEGLGYQGFGNNYNNQDNYIGLTGENNGDFLPPTGSELITNYIAVNSGSIINYWADNYSFSGYVEQIIEEGFPYAIDKVSKEIYKRLYHNMAYLVKKKGTTAGLRQLINIWGIPSTILRINEFGGKDKDNSDDYDLWYDRYSYAYTPTGTQNFPSASMVFPWMPLTRNYTAENAEIVPDNFQFRFKTFGIPTSSNAAIGNHYTQSLLVKKSDGDATTTDFDFGIRLTYEPQETGSYNGAQNDERNKYGTLNFFISGSNSPNETVLSGSGIYLPFFDGGWWSVMLQRDQHLATNLNGTNTTYTLSAANNIYNGDDGDQIGFVGGTSASSHFTNLYGSGLYGNALYGPLNSTFNKSWNAYGTTEYDGIYLGGYVSGSTVGNIVSNPDGKMFRGSFQEFRYYSNDISAEIFNDFVMNPESIEGNKITGSESSFDIVNFRAPLGNELESNFVVSASSINATQSFKSLHPAVSGMSSYVITSSFYNPVTSATSSDYTLRLYNPTPSYNKTLSLLNRQPYLLDQPAIGVSNRISNKIQISDGNVFGNILSNQMSIQQDYVVSRSYTDDLTSLEVGFAPSDEVNDDIIATYGHGVIGDGIADPRYRQLKTTDYPKLRETEADYLRKYTKGNVQDYIRLIKYIDDSLFKAIKAYVPARTSITTGIIIKQNMLDRSRNIPTTIDFDTTIAFSPTPNWGTPIIKRDIVLTSSISDLLDGEDKDGLIFGGTGGTMDSFNYYGAATTDPRTGNAGTASYGDVPMNVGQFTQSYIDRFDTIAGQQNLTASTQPEFYTGEFSGSEFPAVTQSLFNNPFAAPSSLESTYHISESVYDHIHAKVEFEIQYAGFGYLTEPGNPYDEDYTVEALTNSWNVAERGLIVMGTSSVYRNGGGDGVNHFCNIMAVVLPKQDLNGNDLTEYTNVGINGEQIFYPIIGEQKQIPLRTAFSSSLPATSLNNPYPPSRVSKFGVDFMNLYAYRVDSYFNNSVQVSSSPENVMFKNKPFNGISQPALAAPFFQFIAYSASSVIDPASPSAYWNLGITTGKTTGTTIGKCILNDPTSGFGSAIQNQTQCGNAGGTWVNSTIGQVLDDTFTGLGLKMSNRPGNDFFSNQLSGTNGTLNEGFYSTLSNNDFIGTGNTGSSFDGITIQEYPGNGGGNKLGYSPSFINQDIVNNEIPINLNNGFNGVLNAGVLVSTTMRQPTNPEYGMTLPPNRINGFGHRVFQYVGGPYGDQPSTEGPIGFDEITDGNLANLVASGQNTTDLQWMNSRNAILGYRSPITTTYGAETTDVFLPGGDLDYRGTFRTLLHLGQSNKAKQTAREALKTSPIPISTASIHTYPAGWVYYYEPDGSVTKPWDPMVNVKITDGSFLSNYRKNTPVPSGYIPNKQIIGFGISKTSIDNVGNVNDLSATLLDSNFQFGPVSFPTSASFNPDQTGFQTFILSANTKFIFASSSLDNLDYPSNWYTPSVPPITYFLEGGNPVTNNNTSRNPDFVQIYGRTPAPLSNGSTLPLENFGTTLDLKSIYYFDYPTDLQLPFLQNYQQNKSEDTASFALPVLTDRSIPFFFSPLLPAGSVNFDNSQYNALLNNFNANRNNSYLMDIDFSTSPTNPVNQAQLIAGTAIKAEIPDSNYTAKSSIIPRYEGSKVTSANYNFPTPAGEVGTAEDFKELKDYVLPEFLNGDTGSWGGDSSFGNTATIDKHPIYFARFRESVENKNTPGTYTFNIDSLITAPFDSKLGKEEFPEIIKIDGSNQNLQSTVSSFEVGRKASVAYDKTITKTGTNGAVINVDYSKLSVGENSIFQGGLELQNIMWNYIDQSSYTNGFIGSVLPTMSFDRTSGPEWAAVSQNNKPNRDSRELIELGQTSDNIRYQAKFTGEFSPLTLNTGSYLHTGSNALYLGGGQLNVSQSVGSQTTVNGNWYGPSLGVIHTINKCIQNKIAFTGSFSGTGVNQSQIKSPGVPDDNLKYNIKDKDLYFSFDPSSSAKFNDYSQNPNTIGTNSPSGSRSLPIIQYTNTQEPFLIEIGDEITIKYTIRATDSSIVNYQDFFVTGVPNTNGNTNNSQTNYYNVKQLTSLAGNNDQNTNLILKNIFAKIEVTPDPTTISPSIQVIDGFQIRRRINADDRVIVYQTAPPKSQGSLTPSGPGFLIPNDLSAVQKLNVESLITQLRGKNAFETDKETDS